MGALAGALGPLGAVRWVYAAGVAAFLAAALVLLRVLARPAWLGLLIMPLVWTGAMGRGDVHWPWALAAAQLALAAAFAGALTRRPRWLAVAAALTALAGALVHWAGVAAATPDPGGAWGAPLGRLGWLVHEAFDPLTGHQDGGLVWLLGGAWLILLATTAAPRDRRERAADVVVLLLALALGAACVVVARRPAGGLLSLWLVAVALLPRPDGRRALSALVATAAAGAVVAVAVVGWQAQRRYQAEEVAPLVRALALVPEGATVACAGGAAGSAVWQRHPLLHGCPALARALRGASAAPLTKRRWAQERLAGRFTHLVALGQHAAPDPSAAERLGQFEGQGGGGAAGEGGEGWGAVWTVYRVRAAGDPPPLRPMAGGSGGREFRWRCPSGQVVVGLDGSLSAGERRVASLRPRCRAVAATGTGLGLVGVSFPGPVLGHEGGEAFALRCPPAAPLATGLAGRAGAQVEQLELRCGEVVADGRGGWLAGGVGRSPAVGGPGSVPFSLGCPEGEVLVGLSGRAGLLVDAVGPVCRPLPPPPQPARLPAPKRDRRVGPLKAPGGQGP